MPIASGGFEGMRRPPFFVCGGLYTWQPSRPEKQVRSVEALRAQLAGMLVGREVA